MAAGPLPERQPRGRSIGLDGLDDGLSAAAGVVGLHPRRLREPPQRLPAVAEGYAEGGALARELGGWRVISWALVLSMPVLLPVALAGLAANPPQSPTAWLGLSYVSAISMFAGFYAWYRGLAEGGIAKISQLQLGQPVLTLGWSALLLGEHVGPGTALAGLAVVGTVALTQLSRRRTTDTPATAIKEDS